jgi:hypothetical protein
MPPRIDVFYGRTDNTTGHKEYTCVVVDTSETAKLRYYDDLYEPYLDYKYKILFEVPMGEMKSLETKAGAKMTCVIGWVQSPLKEVVLQYWKDETKPKPAAHAPATTQPNPVALAANKMSLPTPAAIKIIAMEYGFEERREEASNTLIFNNNPTLINVFYATGGVMTKLSHPTSDYNQLWHTEAYDSAASLADLFANPRMNTGTGYRDASSSVRGCAKCGLQKKRADYSKNQSRLGNKYVSKRFLTCFEASKNFF